jgi:hypothetical protein
MSSVEEEHYREITASVPIAAMGLLPCLNDGGAGSLGLILRDGDADGEVGWQMVGGAIHRAESVEGAAERHLADTLGPAFRWRRRPFERPETVGEHFPTQPEGGGFDARKHSIALSYVLLAETEAPEPQGVAIDFSWFPVDGELPSPLGSDQEPVIRRLLPFARALLSDY